MGISDRALRLCPLCNQGTGDESHYLTECKFQIFSKLRTPLYTLVGKNSPHFYELSKSDKTVFLLNNTDIRILSQVGKFGHEIMEIFKDVNDKGRSTTD